MQAQKHGDRNIGIDEVVDAGPARECDIEQAERGCGRQCDQRYREQSLHDQTQQENHQVDVGRAAHSRRDLFAKGHLS
jgi:hypothetical protein